MLSIFGVSIVLYYNSLYFVQKCRSFLQIISTHGFRKRLRLAVGLERNAHMFDNIFMSDITLTCADSSRVFHTHKYVLGTSSAVFYAMFYGDMAEKASNIHLPDTDEESLQEFLRFLYT
jgi:hypothetical protein